MDISFTHSKQCCEDIESSPQLLWNNDLFTYRNNTLYLKRWIKRGIIFISQIIDNNGKISYNKVKLIVGDSPLTKFEFNSVYNATLKYENIEIYQGNNYQLSNKDIPLTKWTSKQIRTLLTKKYYEKGSMFWFQKFNISQQQDIDLIWTLVPTLTKEQRLIVLQWKILHHIYATNTYLHKIGKSITDTCKHCSQIESIDHFFFNCDTVMSLWIKVQRDISAKLGITVILTSEMVILGIYNKLILETISLYKEINYMIIIAKLAISKFKKGDYPNLIYLYESELKLRQSVQAKR